MQLFAQNGICSQDLVTLNQFYMALQVIWLSDIGTRSKMEVRIQVWEGSELVESHYQWPMCTPTSTADWQLWKFAAAMPGIGLVRKLQCP